jgi:alkanesulfonate monooxygenase SsuD/methylene tetrahydromethanopterin reductase-like flavin-dependent oxidoreductase (luciferase family)
MSEHHNKDSPKHLYARIREVLLRDWDPMGLGDALGAPDDYDAVARELHALVTDPETTAERIAAYLRWVEREQMGLQRRPGMATEAAERVMALMDEAGSAS